MSDHAGRVPNPTTAVLKRNGYTFLTDIPERNERSVGVVRPIILPSHGKDQGSNP